MKVQQKNCREISQNCKMSLQYSHNKIVQEVGSDVAGFVEFIRNKLREMSTVTPQNYGYVLNVQLYQLSVIINGQPPFYTHWKYAEEMVSNPNLYSLVYIMFCNSFYQMLTDEGFSENSQKGCFSLLM